MAFTLLLNADDRSLGRLCQQNHLYASICRSDFFWRRRIEERLDHLLQLRSFFPSWHDFYLTARKPAVYAVLQAEDVKIFNTIQGVYHYLTSVLSPRFEVPPIQRAAELSQIRLDLNLQVYLMFDGDEFNVQDPNRLLLNVGSSSFMINPNFAQLPNLRSEGRFIFYYLILPESEDWSDDPSTRIGLSWPTSDLFKRLKDNHNLLFNGYVELLEINDKYFRNDLYWYSEGRFVRNTVPVLIVDLVGDEFKMTTLPDQYYQILPINDGVPPFLFMEIPLTQDLDLQWEPIGNISNYPSDGTYLVEVNPRRALDELKLPPTVLDQLGELVRLLDLYNIPIEEYLGHRPVIPRGGGTLSFTELMNLPPGIIVKGDLVPSFQNLGDYFHYNVLFIGYDATDRRYVTVIQYNPATGEARTPIQM